MTRRSPIGVLVLALTACAPPARQVERTRDQHSAWLRERFAECLLSLVPDGAGGARYRAGRCNALGLDPAEGGVGSLLRNDAFKVADHHLSLTWRVDDVSQAGVGVSYEWRFDHGSFGKDLISVDSGRVLLPFREQGR
jgi:hypothetical protein